MNIVLMGYRGSGKTTVGRKMAEHLWRDFTDTDALVCKRFAGRTIREIWETEGEVAFRQAECEVVEQVLRTDNQVISLGGGSVMQPAARAAIGSAADAVRIYLKCDPQVLLKRIEADKTSGATRPALSPAGGTLDEIQRILAEREPVYESLADKVFDVTHVTPDDAVLHIIRRCL
jgi:shikimate kinase